ncbi:ABC transporter substrate-binding protein [Acidipropionibacterium thoenii]|uniref:ABC transporter substrate-binding protein n=1 Tax=Acidipropionibacterium thoenii TaxID=1751 RepID=UPI0004060E11|nr:extracellular solute-binding protein [Acidipropionibacterium thoenii]
MAVVAAAALAGTALAGCSASGQQRIVFAFNKREGIPYMQKVVDDYNASQKKVHVVMDTSGIGTTAAGFVRGNPPDLLLANFNNQAARYVTHCATIDLSETAEAKRVRPAVKTLVDGVGECPGRTSAVPYSIMAAGVIYNKQIFARYNLEVPQTYDELIEVCKTLKAHGIIPFYGTFFDSWTVSQGWFDYAAGGSVDLKSFFNGLDAQGTDVGPDSAVSFQKNFLPGMQKMMVLARTYSNADANSRIYGDGNTAMAQGKGAMYLQGPWAFSEIAKTNPKAQLGTFPLPMTNDPKNLKVAVNVDLAAMIPEQSSHQQAAKDFMSYLFQPRIIDAYNASQLGYGPLTDSAAQNDPRVSGVQSYYQSGQMYAGPSYVIPQAIPIPNLAQSMILGADPKGVLAVIDADWARFARRQ